MQLLAGNDVIYFLLEFNDIIAELSIPLDYTSLHVIVGCFRRRNKKQKKIIHLFNLLQR